MRKALLIIATVTVGFLNANATTTRPTNTANVRAGISNESVVQVFDWSVKTVNGAYSGTSLSLFDAKRMINLSARGENITDMKIESYYILKSQLNKKESRLYYWEVESTNGTAQGFSNSENTAERMIQLVAKGAIISYKIIKSKKL